MNNSELNKNLLICLLIFMFAGSFIIGTGVSTLGGEGSMPETDTVLPAMNELDEGELAYPMEDRVYDPVENAEEQLVLARQAEERGCVVVLSDTAEIGNMTDSNSTIEDNAASANRYYTIALSDEQQDKVYALCYEYDLPADLAFGIIAADLSIGDAPGYDEAPHSILHPNVESAAWYMEHYGLYDMNDFDQNARLAVIMLSEYYHRYPDVNKIAMCYELGELKALECWNAGRTESKYSALVVLSIGTLVPREHTPS